MREINVLIERNESNVAVVSSRTIAEQLGKEHSKVLRSLDSILRLQGSVVVDDIILSLYKVKTQTRTYKEYLLTSNGVGIYFNKIQLLKDKIPVDLLEFANMNNFHTYTRFELSFLDMLEEALKELNINGVRQYVVDGYRVDFYIPKLNLAIEYDEQHHATQVDEDIKRQNYIERKLKCVFVRCDYNDSDIKNTMKIIKYILKIGGTE